MPARPRQGRARDRRRDRAALLRPAASTAGARRRARARVYRRTPRSPPPRWPQPYYGSPYAPPAYGRYGSPRPPGAGAPPARLLGRVKWFDVERKQYGFLAPADHGPDLFVHAGDVVGCARRLAPGDAVEFAYGIQAQSGRPKALDVVRLVPAADGPEDGDGRGALGAFAAGDEPLFDGRRLAGVVVRFDAQHRWGFIRPDDPACQPEAGGENFFLHGLDVLDGGGPVVAGQDVEFAVVRSAARRCKAVHCVRLEPPPHGYGDESDASGSDGAPPLPY